MMRENTYLGGEPICAIKRRVSAQLKNNFEHVIEQNKSDMNSNQINQSIDHRIPYVGPPPKPVLFYMN